MSLQRCTGCNCEFPTETVSPNTIGVAKHQCCGGVYDGEPMPCGYVILFGCEHPWWKHQTGTANGPSPMLIPPGRYETTFASEPSATYAATFMGKECQEDGACVYVQREGLGPWPNGDACAKENLAYTPDWELRGCQSFYHRICDLPNYTPNSSTGRHPYHIDPTTGAMVQPSPMVFDLRFASGTSPATGLPFFNRLRELFGGTDDDFPLCCWTEFIDDRNCGTCVVNWDGWTLHLVGGADPFARGRPRITYLEGSTAFWEMVGRPEPWYGIDSTYNGGVFDPYGRNQFALQNADYWPSLPARVCVVPVRWPFYDSPCDDLANTCDSCTPPRGGLMCVQFATCSDGDGTLSGSVTGYKCPSAADAIGCTQLEFNADLPDGVTAAGECGYWWNVFQQSSDTSCDDPQAAYWIGIMVYWDGAAWAVDTYCSDDGITYAQAGSATISNYECTCVGPSFDFSATGVTCICCGCDCESIPETLYATVSEVTNCGCAAPTVVEGTWNGSGWSFPFTCDGEACGFTLTCTDDTVDGFSLETGDAGPGAASPAEGSTCNPLELIFTNVSMCADDGCEVADITITA